MEVFVPCNASHCPDISSSSGSSTADPHNLIKNKSNDLSMNDLKTCLTELVNVEETRISTSGFNLSPEKNDIDNVVKGSECKDLDKSTSGYSAPEKCLSKCATFPPLRGPNVFVGEKGKREEDITAEFCEGNGSAKPFNQCYSRSTSLPVPLKPVSAMKGSREKQQKEGTSHSPKKLSVTWAPDVYDPIPTSVSHVPSDKNQRYRNSGKKSGKYKQKSGGGKSSRGSSSSSKSKDKKQGRKSSGGSNYKLKQPFHIDGVVLVEPKVGTLDYNVGSPDPFCGSSFLKESLTKLHFPVAEAT